MQEDHGAIHQVAKMATTLPSNREPTHPGEMLNAEFIEPLNLTQTDVAHRLGISFPRLNEIINRKRAVTPDTALRLEQLFGVAADFWLTLQLHWDLWHAMRSDTAKAIKRIKRIRQPA
jgi:antitoxin HigA-1